jgi:hypothetical protein
MNIRFNNIQSEWFNSCSNVNSLRDAKKITNPLKYKCEALSCYICFNITNKCNMQHLNSIINKLKVDDSIHVKMLIVQELWKNH